MSYNEIYLPPDPGPGGWSPEFLRIIRQIADEIIANPVLSKKEWRAAWKQMTEDERNQSFEILAPYQEMVRRSERRRMVVKSPQAYLDEKVTIRRFGWLCRWVNEWILQQR